MEEGYISDHTCERCGDVECTCSNPENQDWSLNDLVEKVLPDHLFHGAQSLPEDDWVPTEAEKDFAQRALQRADAVAHKTLPKQKGVKRSLFPEDKQPNLHDYFDMFGTEEARRVSMCRAYASYLSSMAPKKANTKK